MIFFLDFDLTIFDPYTFAPQVIAKDPRFIKEVEDAFQTPSGSPERLKLYERVGSAIEHGEVNFDARAVENCVFSDARSFLEKNGARTVIVTHGNEVLQRYKVETSGVAEMVRRILYVQTLKGPIIKKEYEDTTPEGIFIDDTNEQLESVAQECPWLTVIKMQRQGKVSQSDFPVVQSFTEMKEYI